MGMQRMSGSLAPAGIQASGMSMTGGVLAIDPGTTLGWSYFEPGQRPLWGHTRLGDSGDDPGKVGDALIMLLEARIDVLKPRGIAFESVYVPVPKKPRVVKGGSPFVFGAEKIAQADDRIPMNANTMARLYGLAMLIQTIAWRKRIPCRGEVTGVFCKFFLARPVPRSRAAKKAANVAKCKALGWTPVTQDDADALALGSFAEAKLFPEFRLARPGTMPLFARQPLV